MYFSFAGLPNTNLEGDLKVEHQNCDFKAGLLNLSGKFLYQKCALNLIFAESLMRQKQ